MKRAIYLIIVGVVTLLIATSVALAASQHSIDRSAVSSGGGEHSSPNYRLTDVMGEAVVGTSQSDNYRLRSGFMPVTATYEITGITGEVNCSILPFAIVELRQGATVVDSTTSDAAGNYLLAAPAIGTYDVVVDKDGWRPQTQQVTISGTGTITLDFIGQTGPIPNAPSVQYVAQCSNHYLYPYGNCGLTVQRVAAVSNAYLYPVSE
jgi:hypothetical protein